MEIMSFHMVQKSMGENGLILKNGKQWNIKVQRLVIQDQLFMVKVLHRQG